jgi:uncharacterized membrane protein
MHGTLRKIQTVKLLPLTTVKTFQSSIHVNIYAGLGIPLCTAWNSPEVLVTISYMGTKLISNYDRFSDFLGKELDVLSTRNYIPSNNPCASSLILHDTLQC